jgi:hypothetical protein
MQPDETIAGERAPATPIDSVKTGIKITLRCNLREMLGIE